MSYIFPHFAVHRIKGLYCKFRAHGMDGWLYKGHTNLNLTMITWWQMLSIMVFHNYQLSIASFTHK